MIVRLGRTHHQWVTGVPIDPHIVETLGHRLQSKCEVETQTFVFGELGTDVVPPGELGLIPVLIPR